MALNEAEFQEMLDDNHDAFGVSITIEPGTPGAFVAATGVRARPAEPLILSAIRSERKLNPMAANGADVTETMYEVRDSEVSDVPTGTKVTDGSRILYVHGVDRSVSDLAITLRCRSTKP